MILRSTLQLLRFPFSLFLLPVALLAWSQAAATLSQALLPFVILHLLVYPASNGYNSYMDRDDSPIGGVEKPLQPTRQLWYAVNGLDCLAFFLSFVVSIPFAAGVFVYIVASRLYSWRGLRIKRYGIPAYLWVAFFQGAWVYWTVAAGLTKQPFPTFDLLPALLAALLIAALYPLTQIFQHDADKADSVITVSMLAGYRGTFILSGVLFAAAAAVLHRLHGSHWAGVFAMCTLPAALWMLGWAVRTWRSPRAASYRNSLVMNLLGTAGVCIYFILRLNTPG